MMIVHIDTKAFTKYSICNTLKPHFEIGLYSSSQIAA